MLTILGSSRVSAAPAFRVVVHPDNPLRVVERRFLAEAFLKRVTRWEDDTKLQPADLAPASKARERFSEQVLKRSVEAVRRYWQQRIFSGRALPPPELPSDAAMIAYVAQRRGAVGYVSGDADVDGVRVVAVK